ncbi:hypothetical protein, partial [Paractinoplanes toevensis]|uniref:hypothetical protein n=1 Tax=Paractinoplanes toevensis TaxID=571911 RepID=UPI001BB3BB78
MVEAEQVEQGLLGVGHVGEDALGAGAAFAAVVVQQDGFADAGEWSRSSRTDIFRPAWWAWRRIRCAVARASTQVDLPPVAR